MAIRAMFWFFLGETAKELIKRGCIKFFEILENTKGVRKKIYPLQEIQFGSPAPKSNAKDIYQIINQLFHVEQ
jgi:hypothetical protein